jgi:hypothetical protein
MAMVRKRKLRWLPQSRHDAEDVGRAGLSCPALITSNRKNSSTAPYVGFWSG